MPGPIKRWFNRLRQAQDHSMNVVYASPVRDMDHSMNVVYASPVRDMDHRMNTIYDCPAPFGSDDRERQEQYSDWLERAVYPNNHMAPESKPLRDMSRITTGSFSLTDLTPEAPKQRLDSPEGLGFLYSKTGGRISLSDPIATIGRGDECTIVLGSQFISSLHAALTFEGGFWYIQDCGSTNGTKLNGVRLTPRKNYLLRPKDKIIFARDDEFFTVLGHGSEGNGGE